MLTRGGDIRVELVVEIDISISWYESRLKNKQTAQGGVSGEQS
jgi:hypothetical protein